MNAACAPCPRWCNDHQDLGQELGISYHRSKEREVAGRGVILVGPGGGGVDDEGGVYLVPCFEGTLPAYPLTPQQAVDLAEVYYRQAEEFASLARELVSAGNAVARAIS